MSLQKKYEPSLTGIFKCHVKKLQKFFMCMRDAVKII